MAGTAVKTTDLRPCNGTSSLFLQNSYALNGSLNEDDNIIPYRCTRELSNNHKIVCHELKPYHNLTNVSLNHFNDYFRVMVKTKTTEQH